MNRFLITAFLIFAIISYGYNQSYKYGKVSKELLELKECPFEKEAPAMFTISYGQYKSEFMKSEGLLQSFEIKKQIKVFDNMAKSVGSYEYYYYSPEDIESKTKIIKTKGTIYNLIDGKIEETKLPKENIYDERITDNIKKLTINFPKVSASSVLEFDILIQSKIFYYNNWYIQEVFPIAINEFNIIYPDFFNLRFNTLGGIAPIGYEEENKTETIFFFNNRFNFDFKDKYFRFENVKSYQEESFCANESDYFAKIENQLISVQIPNQRFEAIATDYNTFTKKKLEYEDLGKILEQKDCIFEDGVIIDTIKLNKAKEIYKKYQKEIKWNEKKSISCDIKNKKLLKNGVGNIAEINLNYIACLNQNGVKSFPLLLSTRGNGTPHPVYPSPTNFDYIAAISYIDGQYYFSDASSRLPFGYLPLKAINGNSWLLDKQLQQWVQLNNKFSGQKIQQSQITFENKKAKYHITEINKEYAAFSLLEILDKKGETEMFKNFILDKYNTDTISIISKDDKTLKTDVVYSENINDETTILLNPFIDPPFKKNPFNTKTRIANIDFPYLQSFSYIAFINANDNFDFELPKDISFIAANDKLKFTYTSSFDKANNKLSITAQLKVLEQTFLSAQYEEIKMFFENVVNKFNEPIVLKKK
jgi:hypothetical protein